MTATDFDGGVNRIEILSDNVVIASESCGNIFSCTKSFILRVPDALNAVYTFVARVFDNLGASSVAVGSGITASSAPSVPLPDSRENALDDLRMRLSARDIFVSSIVPDTSCLSPGAETYLYISLSNRGEKTLRDVKITAVVEELGIRAVSGPFEMKKGGSASRFLYFIVPASAGPGEYYVKVAVSSGKDSIVNYRIFEVNRGC